jgi:C-terminal processing protease CtpA/Prc
MDHEPVVQRISSNPLAVDLLVVADLAAHLARTTNRMLNMSHDEVDLDLTLPHHHIVQQQHELQQQQQQIQQQQQQQQQTDQSVVVVERAVVQQRRVQLIPGVKSLGISLVAGGKINQIDRDSPSDRAGLRAGDKIVEVNGQSVVGKSNKEIAKLIKEHEQSLVIGVIAAPSQPQQSVVSNEREVQATLPAARSQSTSGGVQADRVQMAPEPQSSNLASASGKKLGKLNFFFLFNKLSHWVHKISGKT